jgi:hypothetical protein
MLICYVLYGLPTTAHGVSPARQHSTSRTFVRMPENGYRVHSDVSYQLSSVDGVIYLCTSHRRFCPSGNFPPPPPPSGRNLNPNLNFNKCLDVRGGVFANGTPVQMLVLLNSSFSSHILNTFHSYDCNGTGAQKWVINRGNTKVRVNGTNFCLDAGPSPSSLSFCSVHD